MTTLTDALKSATSVEDIASLLAMMGQTSSSATPDAPELDSNYVSLLKGVNPVGNMPKDLEGVKKLLAGMGASNVSSTTSTSQPKPNPKVAAIEQAAPFNSELSNTLASVQERVNFAMQDPAFRKLVGGPAPASTIDPLAADRSGFNLPKTGQVNTTGAAQRINARASAESTGVAAVRQADGSLLLTNVGAEAAANGGVKIGAGSLRGSGTMPSSMTSLMEKLRTAGDATTANTMLDTIKENAAIETVNLNKQALEIASGNLGIPAMEKALMQSEAADRADRQYYPGIGDSAITKSTRQQLAALRSTAVSEADKFLSTNLTATMLKSQVATATGIATRITSQEDKATNLKQNIELRDADRRGRMEDNAAEVIAGISPQTRAAILTMSGIPKSNEVSDVTLLNQIKAIEKDPLKSKALAAARSVNPDDMFLEAVSNNSYAKTLMLEKEREFNPGISEQQFNAKVDSVTRLSLSKDYVENLAKTKFASLKSEEARKFIAEQNTKKADKSPEATRERIKLSIDLARASATPAFLSDVNQWGITDPEFLAARDVSIKMTGKSDFKSVLDTYMASSTGEEAASKLRVMVGISKQAFGSQTNSMFGKPDYGVVEKILSDRGRGTQIGAAIISKFLEVDKKAEDAFDQYNILNKFELTRRNRIDPTTDLPYRK